MIMGFVGDALLESAKTFGIDGSTGVFIGFIFLTIFCGFSPLVIAYALNGKSQRSSLPS
tara:strand:- start:295 stop:471 length:177 start_codon:yes stop_codon:yes gene_type:complete